MLSFFNFLRKALQQGYARNLLSVVLSLISASVFISLLNQGIIPPSKIAIIFQLSSALTAILSSIAYSLRNRSLDLYLKMLAIHQKPHDARKTGQILTNLIILSFITSLANYLLSIFILEQQPITNYILSFICIFMSTICAVQYIYVLFSHEKLENLIITNMALHYFHEDTKGSLNNISLSNIKEASDQYPDEWKTIDVVCERDEMERPPHPHGP